MTYRMEQMGLTQADAAIDKEWVVSGAWMIRDGPSSGQREPIGRTIDERFKLISIDEVEPWVPTWTRAFSLGSNRACWNLIIVVR